MGFVSAFHRLAGRAKSAALGLTRPSQGEQYVTAAPAPQHALDIFKGEWQSKLPSPLDTCDAGTMPLFGDPRLSWAVERLGGVRDRRVLELGPLEGGHSWMLEQLGAAQVVAVEASTRAYVKCLIVKELTGLTRVRFLCGDSVAFLRDVRDRFDVVVASGILYHMTNPVELLAQIAAHTDRVYLWTCYYDEAVVGRRPKLAARFDARYDVSSADFAHAVYRFHYRGARFRSAFSGGTADYSHWLTRETIVGALGAFGFDRIETAFEEPDHPNGPALALVAIRTSKAG